MLFDKELEHAVRHQAIISSETKKLDDNKELFDKIKQNVEAGEYKFYNYEQLVLQQFGKKRRVVRYVDPNSIEAILCQCMKQIIDKKFRVRYPNRNKVVKELFGIIEAAKQMTEFTIVRFDFQDYFNSLSSEYVYEKFIKAKITERQAMTVFSRFVSEIKRTYAGLSVSNAMAEIAAQRFDQEIRQRFLGKGLLFYERYVDDGILVFNENYDEKYIKEILKVALKEIYHDKQIDAKIKCKTDFNENKFSIITRKSIELEKSKFNYLGYDVFLELAEDEDKNKKKSISITYGITKEKQRKYSKRIRDIIELYSGEKSENRGDVELLRHRILAFVSREVYLAKKYKTRIWKVKGFISNYSELRYLLKRKGGNKKSSRVHSDTEQFLDNIVVKSFDELNVPKPYFLKDYESSTGYNLKHNLGKNRTILLVDHIGYSFKALVKLCKSIGISDIDAHGHRKSYEQLARDYLIKTKVGY